MIEDIKGGARLHLFIQPNSSKDEMVGPHNGELKIKISAPPTDGKANEALIRFLARRLGLPKKDLTVIRGNTGRHKVVEVNNLSSEELRSRLGL